MKIAIISDTHDNWPNIKKVLDWIKKQGIEILIHCGDVCAPVTLKEICKQFTGQIHLVFGNVDGEEYAMTKRIYEGETPNVKLYKNIGEFEIDGKKIAITHYPKTAKALAKTDEYDLVFYGHNHKPWTEKIGNTHLTNPGNIANMMYKPSFATYDTKTDKLELKILDQI